jgi:hypothetical protein
VVGVPRPRTATPPRAPAPRPPARGAPPPGAPPAAVVTVSAAGKRLFFEVNGDAVHTNVLRYLGGLD